MPLKKNLNEYLHTLPVFVSFPRSGSNWLQAVMELYFNRHRVKGSSKAPSWLKKPQENPMWTHSHDGDCTLQKKNKVVFLYRDPVDAIFSLCKISSQNINQINGYCNQYKKLFNKWYKINDKEILILRYEDIIKNPHDNMKKISEFFDKKFDLEKSKEAFQIVGDKQSVVNKNGPAQWKNKQSGTPKYEKEREEFRKKFAEHIYKMTNFKNK